MKRAIALLLAALLALTLAAAALAEAAPVGEASLADGAYTATFTTDNSMFHVNEMLDDKGTLTVANGEMTIHVSLASKNIVNLFFGLKDDAKAEGAALIEPTVDTIDYGDGTTGDVYGFDIPVPAIGEEFDVAILGKKGKWYDHKVMVSDPVPLEEAE